MSRKAEEQVAEIKSYIEILERGKRMDLKFLDGDEYIEPAERLRYEGRIAMRDNIVKNLKDILGIKP